jgi:hypothetical protein
MILAFVLTYIGAVTIWFFKGMRTDMEEELSMPLDRDFKYYRNYFTGLGVLLVVISVCGKYIF